MGRIEAMDGHNPPRRLAREEKTLAAMIAMYCRDHHADRPRAVADSERAAAVAIDAEAADGAQPARRPSPAASLCEECSALLDYARTRLARCPYGVDKPTCAKCVTHCYKPAMREQVRAVMRYAGPRMVREHPLLAAAHLTDGRRKTPPRR